MGGDWFSGNVREPCTCWRQYSWQVRSLKMGPVGCAETTVTNYTPSLRNILQEQNINYTSSEAWNSYCRQLDIIKVLLWDLDTGFVMQYYNACYCCLWLPYYWNIVSEDFVSYRAYEGQTVKRINFGFPPCIIIVNHFYCPTNALNYTNLEVKIYVV